MNALFVGFGQESQQQKEKILKKALECSRPIEALKLLSKVGVDVKKEGIKYGLQSNIDEVEQRKLRALVQKFEKSDLACCGRYINLQSIYGDFTFN